MPTYSRYTKKIILHDKYLSRKLILNFIESQKIPVIDVHKEIFYIDKDPLKFFPNPGGHYNEKGYKLIAKKIIEKINDD